MKRPELLAPVASAEMLTAALRTGADAVYLGIGKFNARQHANDFGSMTLADIVRECHLRGVAVHLALNTLVRQEEFADALACAKEACACGVDALIVQDLGLATAIHAAAPEMTLHASTQCSCHTPSGVRALSSLGFERVVLSRELSAEEIAACVGQGAEIEAFIHGALCMSVSGQCYFSAMLGGRSGNRGLCAQTCRLPFVPSDVGNRAVEGKHAALSLKDMSLLDRITTMAELGVDSCKIEGRRKRPEYVAAACTAYRMALDGEEIPETLKNDLQSVFSRSGFTDGYYTGRRKEMFGTRRKEDVTAASSALSRLQALYRAELPRVEIAFALALAADAPAQLTVTDHNGNTATVTGEIPSVSDHPMSEERIRQQLSKTGGTPYRLTALTVKTETGLTMAASALNALRRAALERLSALRSELHPIEWNGTPTLPTAARSRKEEWWARFSDAEQVTEAAIGEIDRAFLPLDTDAEVLRRLANTVAIGVEIPRALWGMEETVRVRLAEAKAAGATCALCGNVGAIPLAVEAGLQPIGGFGLNVTNTASLAAYCRVGLAAATLSQELTLAQMRHDWDGTVGALVYGRQPLMLVRNCPRRETRGCDGCNGHNGALTDRLGVSFPLECHRKTQVEVLNSAPLWWADKLDELPPLDFRLLHFTDESPETVASVLHTYRHGGPNPKQITRGLYRRGVE